MTEQPGEGAFLFTGLLLASLLGWFLYTKQSEAAVVITALIVLLTMSWGMLGVLYATTTDSSQSP